MQSLTQEDLIRISYKRKWWILASIILSLVAACIGWLYFPKTFKSTVVVTLDSPRVAKDYVKGLSLAGDRPYDELPAFAVQQVNLGLSNRSILVPFLDTLKPYPDQESKPVDSLIKRLRKSISVTRAKDGIGVAISFLHEDPHTAQAGATLLVGLLQQEDSKRREGVVETTSGFLTAELERLKADLEVKERAISDFKRAYLGELPQQTEANLRTLDRLEGDLTTSTATLNKLGDRLVGLDKAIKEFSELSAAETAYFDRDGLVRPATIDPRIARLRELKHKLNQLLATYKENYPDIVYLREEINRLESTQSVELLPAEGAEGGENAKVKPGILHSGAPKTTDPYLRALIKERDEVKSEVAFLKDKQERVTRQIRELEGRIERAPMREQSLAILLRDYDNLQKSYQTLLDKRTSARILENYENHQFGEQYRIIEAAHLPDWAEPPNQIHFLLGGLMVGCLIGFGSAIGVEYRKTGFRRPEEAEHYLGLPVIASIPTFSSATRGFGMVQSRALLAGPSVTSGSVPRGVQRTDYHGKPVSGELGRNGYADSANGLPQAFHLITKWAPASLIAEQYRVAATRLIIMTAEKKNVVTLVTSSVMGEGKTTTSANIAYVLAHDLGKSTLLIDCDLKRPMIHEYMGVPVGPGLCDLLDGSEGIENCLHRYEGIPLWVMPAGSPQTRPIGLRGIQQLKALLPALKERYEYVICDAPPVMPLADVNVLESMADMTIFVVCAGRTNQDIAKKALKTIGLGGDASIILTQVEMEYTPYFMYAAPYAIKDYRTEAR